MVEDKYVLIPWYHKLSHDRWLRFFFFGRLRVPTRRCDLGVPADWGWGRSNEDVLFTPHLPELTQVVVAGDFPCLSG